MRMNRKVSIWKHVRLADGNWRYCRPVLDNKGKIVPNLVHVNSHEEQHPEGEYYICYYGPKLTWQKCGPKPADALAAADRQRALFKAMEHGIVQRPQKVQNSTIDEAVTNFLQVLEAKVANGSKRPKTYEAYKQVLREFQVFCERLGKHSLSKITNLDVINYAAWARKQSPTSSRRTANTKFVRVNSFLKANGLALVTYRDDAPKYPKDAPVHVYSDEQLQTFFAKCNSRQRAVFKTLLMAGLRKSELVFLTHDRLHLDKGYIRIDENPKYDFMPKAYQVRDVYIPDELVEILRMIKPRPGCDLVFPTRYGTPNLKLLVMCRGIGKRAGMNQDEFWLHKWRSTYATHCLRNGMDLATLRDQMGHKDLKSIERYLKALQQDERGEKVRRVWAKAA